LWYGSNSLDTTRITQVPLTHTTNVLRYQEYHREDEAQTAIEGIRKINLRGSALVAEVSVNKSRTSSGAPPSATMAAAVRQMRGKCHSCGEEGHWYVMHLAVCIQHQPNLTQTSIHMIATTQWL
jgi:hypothetical protein